MARAEKLNMPLGSECDSRSEEEATTAVDIKMEPGMTELLGIEPDVTINLEDDEDGKASMEREWAQQQQLGFHLRPSPGSRPRT